MRTRYRGGWWTVTGRLVASDRKLDTSVGQFSAARRAARARTAGAALYVFGVSRAWQTAE